MSLQIAKGVQLPLDAVTETLGILAIKRVGKTYTASVIAEEMVAAKLPWVALDPTGAWWGLRSSADGKHPGLPVTIIGGRHGDLPLDPASGALVADLVIEHPGYYVIDLEMFDSNEEQDAFALPFFERLYRGKRGTREPLHVFIDEADEFAPQELTRKVQNQVRDAVDRLVRRGGLRGLGVTMITQRPQAISKSVLSQVGTLIILRNSGHEEIESIKKRLTSMGGMEQVTEIIQSAPFLERGEAWICSPSWLGKFQRVQIRQRQTYNSSATPEIGDRVTEPEAFSSVDLDAIRQAMAESIENLQSDNPEVLRKQIEFLKDQLKTRPAATIEVPVIAEEEWEALCHVESVLKDATELFTRIVEGIASMRGLQHPESQVIEQDKQPSLSRIVIPYLPPEEWSADPKPTTVADIERMGKTVKQVRDLARSLAPAPPKAQQPNNPTTPAPKLGARKMLEILARHHPMKMTRAQLATFAGYAKSGGTYKTYLSKLRTEGFTQEIGGYISLTKEGLAAAGVAPNKKPMTTEEVLTIWRRALKAGARKMLDIIVAAYPNPVGRQQLARAMGMEVTGGTFKTYISHLKVNGLATTAADTIRASDSIFIGGKK
jgi:hypothetical protein